MSELRWVLLALGVLVILAVYAWGRGTPRRWRNRFGLRRKPQPSRVARVEPAIDELDGADDSEETVADEVEPEQHIEPEPAVASEAPAPVETVVTLRFIPSEKEIPSDRVILALRKAGLKHGRYGIFHYHADELSGEPMFSVANLTEPGSFDLTRLSETRIRGMSFFMVLPGVGDPVERFDRMVETARALARELHAELRDEKGSSWSIQRERYVREEIIEYRHSMDRSG